MAATRTELPNYTEDEIKVVLSATGQRVAYSLGELAEMLGVNKRRLTQLLDEMGVKTFYLGNRRMIKRSIVARIVSGKIDVGKPPKRQRGADGMIVGAA